MSPSLPGQSPSWGRPRQRTNVVVRPRLYARLDEGLDVGAVRVSAAAGSGKTTLLAAWIATLPTGVCSPWLTLQTEHNDPVRLADDLHAVLLNEGVVLDRLDAPRSLAEVFAALGEPTSAPPFVLVLDDMHVIENPTVVSAIASVLGQVPTGSCIVVSGREDHGLPWATLRERRVMVELVDADLRFNEGETHLLLERLFGIEETDRRIAGAVAAAEGWVAGVLLAGMALQLQPDEPIEIALSPRHRQFVDGFIEETILAACSREVREFLLATSILPILEPSLCDVLTDRHDSRVLLRELADRNVLTEELAGPRPSFRYHSLLRRTLQESLGREGLASLSDKVERVVTMLAAEGRLVEATELALEAGPSDDAEKWVRQASGPAMARGYAATVAAWLSALPDDLLQSQPDLLLVLARAAGVTGDLLTAKAAVRRVHHLVDGKEISPGVRIGLQTLDTAVALWEGSLAQSVSSLRDLLPLVTEQPKDPTLDLMGLTRASILSPLAAGLLFQGLLDDAVNVADQVIGLDEVTPLTRHAVLCLGVRALAHAWAGREHEAAACVEEAMPLVATWRTGANEAIFLWAAAAWVGPRSQAEQNLARAQGLTSRTPVPLLKALPAVTALRVRQRLGQYDRLSEAAQRAREALASVPEPGHLADVLHEQLLRMQQDAGSTPDLSRQELSILQLIAAGRSRNEVAEQMHYSVNTVKTYLRSTYRKLGASDRSEALARARAWGLLE